MGQDYKELSDTHLDRLKSTARPLIAATLGRMTLPAKTVYALAMELTSAREEIFRLRICETVEQIIAEELNDGDYQHIQFKWPDDVYLLTEMESGRIWESATFQPMMSSSPGADGRRMPRAE